MAKQPTLTYRELRDYLLAKMPPFKAPTDPVAWRKKARQLRREALEKVFLRGYPRKLVQSKPRVVWTDVLQPDPDYVIRKLRYEVYPNYWAPALLYEPRKLKAAMPVMLNPNGHHAGGKAAQYKQARCINLAKRGVIALSPEWIGMGELQADLPHDDQRLISMTDLEGVGLFYLALKKGLDVLLSHKHADRKRVGVTGLSGGGWQTIVISALDERVTLSVPVAGYTTTRARIEQNYSFGDMEQAPPDHWTVVDYDDMTAMLAPRPALLILNANDECCFKTGPTRPVIYDAVRPTYHAFGALDKFETYSNREPGTHNYDGDNRSQLYRFLQKHWGISGPDFDIHSPSEILPEDALRVGLPPEQTTMRGIAIERAKALAPKRSIPRTKAQRRELRRRLAQVIRLPKYKVERRGGKVRIGPFTVPLHRAGSGSDAVLRLADDGFPTAKSRVADPGKATFCAEVFMTGQAKISTYAANVLEAAGERILGVQVGQVLALARHIRQQTGARRIEVKAIGRFSAFAAFIAAALEPRLFHTLTIAWETMRLDFLPRWPLTFGQVQSMCCPQILTVADVPEFEALLENVVFNPYGRAVKPSVPTSAC